MRLPVRGARRRVRQAGEWLLGASGATRLHTWLRPEAGALILMYHSVPDARLARWMDPSSFVPLERFERQMRFLAQRRRVISMRELVERLERGETSPTGSVVLTFDDGYVDNLHVVAPILLRYALPATLYVPTGLIARGESPWVDRLHTIFRTRNRHRLALAALGEKAWDLGSPGVEAETYQRLRRVLLGSSQPERETLLSELERELRPSERGPRLTLSWDELRRLRKECPLFEIGIHSRDHVDLSRAAPDALPGEIEGARADAERALEISVEHFSYPYGRLGEAVRDAVARSGMRTAVATEPARPVVAGTDRYRLPRLGVSRALSLTRFRAWTSGALPALSVAVLGSA